MFIQLWKCYFPENKNDCNLKLHNRKAAINKRKKKDFYGSDICLKPFQKACVSIIFSL